MSQGHYGNCVLILILKDERGVGRAHWVQVRQGCDRVLDMALGDLHVSDASFSIHNNLRRCIMSLVLKT